MSTNALDRGLARSVVLSAPPGRVGWNSTTGRQGKRDRRRSVPKGLVGLLEFDSVNFGAGVGAPPKINDFNGSTGVVRLPQLSENHESA
jgi:hypothetical protein